MEIPAWLWFSFWALVSTTFLQLGFYSLDKTEVSASVSPVVMSFFKHCLAISSCCSSGYALIYRPQWSHQLPGSYFSMVFEVIPVLILWVFLSHALIQYVLIEHLPPRMIFFKAYTLIRTAILLPTPLFPAYFLIAGSIYFILISEPNNSTLGQKISIGIHMAMETSLLFVSQENTKLSPVLVLIVSFFISAFWAGFSKSEPCNRAPTDPLSRVESFKPLAAKVKEILSMLEKKAGKFIKFAIGLGGTALFQYFFRLTSFNQVVAFLYLAVMWVANLALLGASYDFGVLNFLLGNVVMGCTVNQFGLRRTTWLAYAASRLLYGLRLKLESLTFVYGPGKQTRVKLW